MQNKLGKREYKSKEMFEADLMLIFKNAKIYNQAGTVVHKNAEQV